VLFRSRRTLLLTLAAAALLTAGCGGYGDDDEESTPSQSAQPAPPVPAATAGGAIAVEEFNAFLAEEKPAFATSALQTATEFTHAEEGQARRMSVAVVAQHPEGGHDVAVTVERDGLLDDSVRAVRYEILLEKTADGTWRLRSAKRTQACHRDRGHQDFSPQLCT
jgi:hypothetical protein